MSGCAHGPILKKTDGGQTLLAHACEPGSPTKSVKGSVWLKVKSKDASGQFPAWVDAKSPDQLRLEVTNPLGGTEAVITVSQNSYEIQNGKKHTQVEKGYGSWGGIPLEWATDLFLGKIPCPSKESLSDATYAVSPEGSLTVAIAGSLQGAEQRYEYRFRSWGGAPWPEALTWERRGSLAMKVEFKFDDPDETTHSPKKWEAKSIQGEVKARWRERDVSR